VIYEALTVAESDVGVMPGMQDIGTERVKIFLYFKYIIFSKLSKIHSAILRSYHYIVTIR